MKQDKQTKPDFKKDQLDIIDQPVSARQWVEAGPGTGKTAVACARVAKLLRDGVNPSAILMISFTRAAVKEMTDRIRLWSDDGLVNSVYIGTLDQAAFRFGVASGTQAKKMLSSFDENISNTLAVLKAGENTLISYFKSIEHLILDEAQDITGDRAYLAWQLIDSLPVKSGVTVFADKYQSIYGFTSDNEEDGNDSATFMTLHEPNKKGFRLKELRSIHRTTDTGLISFFEQTRGVMKKFSKVTAVEKMVDRISSEGKSIKDINEFDLKDGDLVLFRKRSQALLASQFATGHFRLRLRGYPPAVFPWVAVCLRENTKPYLSSSLFESLWRDNVTGSLSDGWTPEMAWAVLLRHARDGNRVNVRELRAVLSRDRPPLDFCYQDYGGLGPIFSTIHASKGREADRVILMLPRNLERLKNGEKTDAKIEEEARVYYVGATRVRKKFFHGIAQTLVSAKTLADSAGEGRVVELALRNDRKTKFQLGIVGDIDPRLLVSTRRAFCPDEEAAAERQKYLISLWSSASEDETPPEVDAAVHKMSEDYFPFQFNHNQRLIAWSGECLTRDLWTAAKEVGRKSNLQRVTPTFLKYLKMIGIRTIAIQDTAAQASEIHEPYASSGFFLAPMIVGYAMFPFPQRYKP